MVEDAEVRDFEPLVYVMPYGRVSRLCTEVPVKDRRLRIGSTRQDSPADTRFVHRSVVATHSTPAEEGSQYEEGLGHVLLEMRKADRVTSLR